MGWASWNEREDQVLPNLRLDWGSGVRKTTLGALESPHLDRKTGQFSTRGLFRFSWHGTVKFSSRFVVCKQIRFLLVWSVRLSYSVDYPVWDLRPSGELWTPAATKRMDSFLDPSCSVMNPWRATGSFVAKRTIKTYGCLLPCTIANGLKKDFSNVLRRQLVSLVLSLILHAADRKGDLDHEIISTQGNRYDVSLKERKLHAVYWDEEAYLVRRGTWFWKAVGEVWVPYEEVIADKLEVSYGRKGML